MLISQIINGCKEKFFFINQIFNKNIRRLHQGKKYFGTKKAFFCRKTTFQQMIMAIPNLIFGEKKKKKNIFFAEKLFSLMKTSDIFDKNLVNKKKILLAAFYHLTYYHN